MIRQRTDAYVSVLWRLRVCPRLSSAISQRVTEPPPFVSFHSVCVMIESQVISFVLL